MIKKAFEAQKTLFIPFLMAGHPNPTLCQEAILGLAKAGAGLIELGVPFSDPVADGPVNQRAAQLALEQGTTLTDILAMVHAVRLAGCHTPILLFSYINPILAFGYAAFIEHAKKAGINGVLLVDLPPEEDPDFYLQLKKGGLEYALLASPSTNPARFTLYNQLEPSFIYYISRYGVTGVQQKLSDDLASQINKLRSYLPHQKIAVGFGISTPEQAMQVAQLADGVIVGSKLVHTLETQGLAEMIQVAKNLSQFLQTDDNLQGTT